MVFFIGFYSFFPGEIADLNPVFLTPNALPATLSWVRQADAFAYADASGAEFEEPKKEGYRKWITQTYDDDDYCPDDGGQ